MDKEIGMLDMKQKRQAGHAAASLFLATSLMAPTMAGCGRSADQGATGSATSQVRQAPPNYGSVPPPSGMNRGGQQQQRQGMSTGQKLAVVAGAAALLYMYNKNKNKKGTGPEGQYYRSRNGRVYYRDQKGNAVYVTPPAGGIQVPADEAERYNRAARSGDFSLLEGSGSSGNYSDGNYGSGNMGGRGQGMNNYGTSGGMGGNMGDGNMSNSAPRGGMSSGGTGEGAYSTGGGRSGSLPPGPRGSY